MVNSSTQRPSRDQTFIYVARLFADRSTCLRGHVGCVIVKDKRIVSVGYNGAPASLPDCLEVGCDISPIDGLASAAAKIQGQEAPPSLGCQRTIHAELNAVAYAAKAGISLDGATAYCTHSPCTPCAFALSQAGIEEIVYDKVYRLTDFDKLDEMGITFYKWDEVDE